MLIDAKGNLKQAWMRGNGCLIHDSAKDNPYEIEFAIGVYYTEEQRCSLLLRQTLTGSIASLLISPPSAARRAA